ncbi:MAG: hypothetical protein IKM43_00445 [Clostridia bacterium]|nr:hypothetical protein [Clostridia bacterium]
MKKLKIALCALLVLCSGVLFAACGEKEDPLAVFDTTKITVANIESTYDGNSHIFTVAYEEVDLAVEYSIDNMQTFKPASQMQLINADTYSVYYRISANGYETYTSANPISYVINPRNITLELEDAYDLMDAYTDAESEQDVINALKESDSLDFVTTSGSILMEDKNNLDISYDLVDFDLNAVQANDEYAITATVGNTNYNATIVNGSYTVYGSFNDMVALANEGDTIKLNSNVKLTNCLNITKSITIDGQGLYSITNADNYTDRQMMYIAEGVDATLTLKNVKIDGNQKSRGVHAKSGKVVIDGAEVTNCKAVGGDEIYNFVGGVYISYDAEFEMSSGKIQGNYVGENYVNDNYLEYTSDLWIGANAHGVINSTITGGTIGNLFVNANKYSASNAGDFTIDGGTIDNVYVEYEENYGAKLIYNDGVINNLMVSTVVTGEAAVISGIVKGSTIVGGIVASATVGEVTSTFTTPEAALSYVAQNPTAYVKAYLTGAVAFSQNLPMVNEIVLIGDFTLPSMQTITKSVIINGQGRFTITASKSFNGDQMLYVSNAKAEVTLKDVTLDGNDVTRVIKADAGKLTIDGATITNGMSSSFVGGVFITNAAKFEMIKGTITGNSYVGASDADEYYKVYSADLWIGANAEGSLAAINGGTVGKIYVNANEYSATNKGFFTMNNGEVESVYVEFDKTFGADFNFVGGEIEKLYLSTETTGVAQLIENPTTGSYVGGTGIVE